MPISDMGKLSCMVGECATSLNELLCTRQSKADGTGIIFCIQVVLVIESELYFHATLHSCMFGRSTGC